MQSSSRDYYIYDVSFANMILSENKLNSVQGGYNEAVDTGAHFIQARYSFIGQTQSGEVSMSAVVNNLTYVMGKLPIPIVGDIVTFISDVNEFINFISTTGEMLTDTYEALELSNEDLIQFGSGDNNLMKASAISLNTLDSGSRAVLRAGNCVEYITVVDDYEDNWFRIVQNIALKISTNTGADSDSATGVYYRQYGAIGQTADIEVFDNYTVALLNEGYNTFGFSPMYSGKYVFEFSDNISKTFSITNSKEGERVYSCSRGIILQIPGGEHSIIKISYRNSEDIGAFNMSIYYGDSLSIGTTTMAMNQYSDSPTLVCVDNLPTNIYAIEVSPGFSISLVDSNYFILKTVTNATKQIYIDANAKYLLISKVGSTSNNCTIIISAIEDYSTLNIEYDIESNQQEVFIKFKAPHDGQYTLLVSDVGATFKLKPYNFNGSSSIIESYPIYTYSIYMEKDEEVWIGLTEDDTITICWKEIEKVAKWMVNGAIIEENFVWLERNTTSTINFLIDDIVVENAEIECDATTYFSWSNGQLYIDQQAPLNDILHKNPIKLTFSNPLGESYILNIYVKHNLNVAFNAFYEENNFGINNNTINKASYESIEVTYRIKSPIYNINDVLFTSNEGKVDLYNRTVAVNSKYLTSSLIDIIIEKIILAGITVYNIQGTAYTEADNFDKMQCFSFNKMQVSPLFNGGQGTEVDPYLISNYRNLNNLRYNCYSYNGENYISGYFKLTNNINLSGKGAWSPIQPRFAGVLNGNNYYIQNLNITIPTFTSADINNFQFGFFRNVSGTIQNLKFSNAQVIKSQQSVVDTVGAISVGVLAGNIDSAKISNCFVSGSINVRYIASYVGGLIGNAYLGASGKIESCSSSVNVIGDGIIGGIVGNIDAYNASSTTRAILGCSNTGNIELYNGEGAFENCAGGIAGRASNTLIQNCVNTGRIAWVDVKINSETLNPCLGGIIGYAVSDCLMVGCSSTGTHAVGELQNPYKYGGFLGIGQKKHNQQQYAFTVSSGLIGCEI